MDEKKLVSRWDLILIMLIALAALIFYIFIQPSGNGAAAEITLDGEIVKTVKLNEISEKEVFEIGECKITAEPGCIYFSSSPCPDKLCIEAGKLKKAGDVAACLPCRVLISVSAKSAENYIITY